MARFVFHRANTDVKIEPWLPPARVEAELKPLGLVPPTPFSKSVIGAHRRLVASIPVTHIIPYHPTAITTSNVDTVTFRSCTQLCVSTHATSLQGVTTDLHVTYITAAKGLSVKVEAMVKATGKYPIPASVVERHALAAISTFYTALYASMTPCPNGLPQAAPRLAERLSVRRESVKAVFAVLIVVLAVNTFVVWILLGAVGRQRSQLEILMELTQQCLNKQE